MQLMPGSRLRSQVCSTEIIVVRGGKLSSELTCGGSPMVVASGAVASTGVPAPGLDQGSELGKRYGDDTIEVLVTKAGTGSIAVGKDVLEMRQARSLPSSD